MKVIVLASQKGGSGKTTLAGHLAAEALRRGDPGSVVMMDTDPQASLTGWWAARSDDLPPLPAMIRVLPEGLSATLAKVRKAGIGLVVIDTPPAITASITDTCKQADLVVVPVKPSPHDLRAVGATVDIVERSRKPMAFVINQVTQRAKITMQAVVALSQHGTVASPMIAHRVDFQTSMTDGRTASELDPASKSAGEIAQLWDYITSRMERNGTHG